MIAAQPRAVSVVLSGMADVKGSSIVILRNLLREHKLEAQLLTALDAEERRVYDQALVSSWCSLDVVTHINEKAARLLFPNDPHGLRKIGHHQARQELRGIYSIFMRIATVEHVLRQAASLWKTINRAGEASVEKVKGEARHYVITVRNYPNYPPGDAEVTAGYITGALEIGGAKQILVRPDLSVPGTPRWDITHS